MKAMDSSGSRMKIDLVVNLSMLQREDSVQNRLNFQLIWEALNHGKQFA
jgi:hypothetical protein